ncbi:MAG: exodeoxyribonuclease VII small subunit [Porticoccus sp.]|nr:exodeoxyribonuclease VII small subunit [Porticoccus sp.]
MPREKNKTVDFEKKINALEKIVEDMEKGSLSLEESLKFFEDGIKITRECQQALRNAELKVEILTADSNKLEKFDGEVT